MNENRYRVEIALQRQRERQQESYNFAPTYDAHRAQRTPSPPPKYTYPLLTSPSNRFQGYANYDLSPSKAGHVVGQSQLAAKSPRPNTTANKNVSDPEIRLSAEQQRVVDRIVDAGRNAPTVHGWMA